MYVNINGFLKVTKINERFNVAYIKENKINPCDMKVPVVQEPIHFYLISQI